MSVHKEYLLLYYIPTLLQHRDIQYIPINNNKTAVVTRNNGLPVVGGRMTRRGRTSRPRDRGRLLGLRDSADVTAARAAAKLFRYYSTTRTLGRYSLYSRASPFTTIPIQYIILRRDDEETCYDVYLYNIHDIPYPILLLLLYFIYG